MRHSGNFLNMKLSCLLLIASSFPNSATIIPPHPPCFNLNLSFSFFLSCSILTVPLLSPPLCRVAVLVAGDNPCHGAWLGIRTSSLFTAGRMIQRLAAQAPAAAALCWISNMFEWDKRDSLPHRTPPPNPYTAVKWARPATPHLDPHWLWLSLPPPLPLPHTPPKTYTHITAYLYERTHSDRTVVPTCTNTLKVFSVANNIQFYF